MLRETIEYLYYRVARFYKYFGDNSHRVASLIGCVFMMNIISVWISLSIYFDWQVSFTQTQLIVMAVVGLVVFALMFDVFLSKRYSVFVERWKGEDQQSRVFNGIAITIYIFGSIFITLGLLTYSHKLHSVTN